MSEKKILFSKITDYGLLLLGAFLFQTCFAQRIAILHVAPSALIASTLVVGMFGGNRAGMIYGLVLGLLCDATVGTMFGKYALLLMFVGVIAGFLVELQLWRSLLAALLVQFGFYLLIIIGNAILQLLVIGNTKWIGADTLQYIKEAIYTVVVMVPLYYVGLHMNRKYNSED